MGDLDRPRRGDPRVPPDPAQGPRDARPPVPLEDLQLPRRRHAGAEGAGDDRQDLGAHARPAQGQGRAQLRPRDRRRPGHRPRRRLPADAAHVRQRRARRADRVAGRDARPLPHRPPPHRRRDRRPPRGDAGERDRDARAGPHGGGRGHASTGSSATGSTRTGSPRPTSGRSRTRSRPPRTARDPRCGPPSRSGAAPSPSASSSPGSRSSPRRRSSTMPFVFEPELRTEHLHQLAELV